MIDHAYFYKLELAEKMQRFRNVLPDGYARGEVNAGKHETLGNHP